jgi:hypothetical protein
VERRYIIAVNNRCWRRFRVAWWRIIEIHLAMMFDPASNNEREDNENDEALFAWRKDKHCEQPLHLVA